MDNIVCKLTAEQVKAMFPAAFAALHTEENDGSEHYAIVVDSSDKRNEPKLSTWTTGPNGQPVSPIFWDARNKVWDC